MNNSFHRLLDRKLSSDTYLRSTFVLGIDMIVSLLASAVVIFFADMLTLQGSGTALFTIVWMSAAFIGSLVGFYLTRSYQGIIRHSSLRELATVCEATIVKFTFLLAAAAIFLLPRISLRVLWILPSLDFLITVSALVIVRISMVLMYDFLRMSSTSNADNYDKNTPQKILVYGIGDKSVSLTTRFHNSTHYEMIGYLVRPGMANVRWLNGKPIYQFENLEDLLRIKDRLGVDGIMFPNPPEVKREKNGLVDYSRHINLKLYVAPSIDELKDGDADVAAIRDIKIEDLLGRDEIDISLEEVSAEVNNKTVLVTGAAGSIGSELCRQLSHLGIARLIMFDNAETPLHNLRLEFEDKFKWVEFIPIIGDVRSQKRVDYIFKSFRPDMVFHAAAYKHVPLMEENPCEAILVNVEGSKNIADMCVRYGVEKMVMISTDKAVNPTNIMGCTKRIAEIYVQTLGLAIESGLVEGDTRFVTTRFGNVLGSNGSVIPRFKEQISAGGPVTVTHPEIRRFFMTIPEACRLVLEAATLGGGTHIYAFDMGQPVKIADLAKKMIHLAGYEIDEIKIVYSGLRPGEKLYEEVLADKENTIPTSHQRIFKAMVREYKYSPTMERINEMVENAKAVNVECVVKMMKEMVPEFKSKHSKFEEYDKR